MPYVIHFNFAFLLYKNIPNFVGTFSAFPYTEGDERSDEEEWEATEGTPDEQETHAPKDFKWSPWFNPTNTQYGRGKRIKALYAQIAALAEGTENLEQTEQVFVTLAEDEPSNYQEAMGSTDAEFWRAACEAKYANLRSYGTWTLVEPPPNTNIIGNRWTFHVKRDNLGQLNKRKARLVAHKERGWISMKLIHPPFGLHQSSLSWP